MTTVGRRARTTTAVTADVTTGPGGLVLLLDRVADSLLGLTTDREPWGESWAAGRDGTGPGARATPAPSTVIHLDTHRGSRSQGRDVAAPAPVPASALATSPSTSPSSAASSGPATDADLRLRRRAAIEQASRRRARRRLRRLGLRVR